MPFRGLAPNMVILGVLAVVQPETGISAVWTVFHAVTVTRAQIVVFGQFFVLRLAWVDSYQGSRPLSPPNDPWAILWGPSRWRPPRNDLIFEYFTLRGRFH